MSATDPERLSLTYWWLLDLIVCLSGPLLCQEGILMQSSHILASSGHGGKTAMSASITKEVSGARSNL